VSSSIEAYRSVDVSTANPRSLLVRAYDRAICALEEAEEGLKAGLPFERPLHKALTLVSGLMSALDFEAGEIAQRLLQLYLFVIERIRNTFLERRDCGLAQGRRVLTLLRAAWMELRVEEGTPTAGASDALRIRVRG
jgi:flagellar protein FliS